MRAIKSPQRPMYPQPEQLSKDECRQYRDRLRTARYAALADSEGFAQICFELEALGVRMLGLQATMNSFKKTFVPIAEKSAVISHLCKVYPGIFKSFNALFEIVRKARNDNMHLGAYARHATAAAIELCIGIEEGLMAGENMKVSDVIVKGVVTVDPWQPLAYARQLMLMHSFSFLPLYFEERWHLLSELAIAKFLQGVNHQERNRRLGSSIEAAVRQEECCLKISKIDKNHLLKPEMSINDVLSAHPSDMAPTLWLVVDEGRESQLLGILSPFELM